MKPTPVSSKTPGFGGTGFGRRLSPWRTRQRWTPLRETVRLTQRRITSVTSSSDSASSLRNAQIRRSSTGESVVVGVFGACERSATDRSEEQTSELQSLMRISYDVFCLKKNNHKRSNH